MMILAPTLLVCLVIAIRLIAGEMDRGRIREHVESNGGRIINISWNPFGRGWFGSERERIYEVRYYAPDGHVVEGTCKTSLFSGVYWTSGGAPVDFMDSRATPNYPPAEVNCRSCGSAIQKGDAVCPVCGSSYRRAK